MSILSRRKLACAFRRQEDIKKNLLSRHTIEICRADKGDMDTEVAMVCGTVKTEIDTEGN